jgi:hypothetical protein
MEVFYRARNENRRPILRSKSLIDFHIKIGIRFHVPSAHAVPEPGFNRDPICRSKSLIYFSMKIGIRLCNENRSAIFPEWFTIAIVIAIAFSKPEPACEMMHFKNHYQIIFEKNAVWFPYSETPFLMEVQSKNPCPYSGKIPGNICDTPYRCAISHRYSDATEPQGE